MITIYHNPRCSKSREGLHFLEENEVDFQIVKYLDEPLNKAELTELIEKLGIKPIELVRTKEDIWKENYKDKNLSDEEIIEAMAENPKLIERPIVVNGDKAVIARPFSLIKNIL